MSCPCIQSDPIGVCAENLTVGTIDDIFTDVMVYLKNTTTGWIGAFPATSDINGVVSIELEDFVFGENMNYQITMTLDGAASGDLLEFTVGENTGTCVWFSAVTLDGVTWSLGSSEDQGGVSVVRYRVIDSDSGWPEHFWITGVNNNSAIVTATLGDPADFKDGQIRTFTDEGGAASLYNHRLVGPFEDGDSFKDLTADRQSIDFYSNGTNFVLTKIY